MTTEPSSTTTPENTDHQEPPGQTAEVSSSQPEQQPESQPPANDDNDDDHLIEPQIYIQGEDSDPIFRHARGGGQSLISALAHQVERDQWRRTRTTAPQNGGYSTILHEQSSSFRIDDDDDDSDDEDDDVRGAIPKVHDRFVNEFQPRDDLEEGDDPLHPTTSSSKAKSRNGGYAKISRPLRSAKDGAGAGGTGRWDWLVERVTLTNDRHRRILLYILGLVFLLLVALSVGMDLLFSQRNGAQAASLESLMSGEADFGGPVGNNGAVAVVNPAGSNGTAQDIAKPVSTEPADPAKPQDKLESGAIACFQETSEIQGAVDLYLMAFYHNTSMMREFDKVVGSIYGIDITEWCLGEKLRDVSHLFASTRSSYAPLFNEDISGWDVSRIENMESMFSGATNFNQPLRAWNTSNVKNMAGLFADAHEFNQDISMWDTSNVVNMTYTFGRALKFSQPLNDWNVAKVQTFQAMFEQAYKFNQPLDKWDTSSALQMGRMFHYATSFNQPINSWNVSQVVSLYGMFLVAKSFNQPLDLWKPDQAKYMNQMFSRAETFDQDLCSWGPSLAGRNVSVNQMFKTTKCTMPGDPNVNASPPDPLCSSCT